MIVEGALNWLAEKARKGLIEPGLLREWEEKVATLQAEVRAHEVAKSAIDNVYKALGSGERNLWTSAPPQPPFADYNDRIARQPVKGQANRRPLILTTINYKGGVGKTTTTANLAAYFDRKLNKRVLIVDLDYQGSMTTILQSLAGHQGSEALVGGLLGEGAPEALVARSSFALGQKMPRSFFVPSFYPLARLEEQLMVEWLLQRSPIDVRYRLARTLLDDSLGRRFDVVLIDAAPRLTTATINALTASTHVLIPAVMNPVSSEPVINFLEETQKIMVELNPRLAFVGVVETMAPPANEKQTARDRAIVLLDEQLRAHAPGVHRLSAIIRRKPALTWGEVAYTTDSEVREMFDTLGDEIVSKVGTLS